MSNVVEIDNLRSQRDELIKALNELTSLIRSAEQLYQARQFDWLMKKKAFIHAEEVLQQILTDEQRT